jgi:hypothetical protein
LREAQADLVYRRPVRGRYNGEPGVGAGLIQETQRMMRFWSLTVLALAAAFTTGCSNGGKAIYASAPAGGFSTHYTVRDGGRYSLYRVTNWNKNGQPEAAEQIATYDLRPGEKLGFNWVTDRSKMYDPDAHANLEAYAGSHRNNLGAIVSRNEKYYWADPNGWNAYWAGEPGRNVQNALTMQ